MGIECVNNLAVTILDDTRNGGVVRGVGGVVHGMGDMVHGFSVNTTSEAVLFPISMILAASVWEA